MPISPWTVGATKPVWSIQSQQDASVFGGLSQPLNITGSTITLHAKITDSNGNVTGSDLVGSGIVSITDGPNGKFTYQPNSTDFFVTTVGIFLCQWKHDYGGGQVVWSDIFQLAVQAAE